MVLENHGGCRDVWVFTVRMDSSVCVIILHPGLPATEQKMMLNRAQQVNAAQVIWLIDSSQTGSAVVVVLLRDKRLLISRFPQ